MINSLLLHIPHSSVFIPKTFGVVSNETKNSINFLTDSFTDDLFVPEKKNKNIQPLIFQKSRFFCDVERFWDDEIESMSRLGQGVFYEKLPNGSENKRIDSKNDIKQFYNDHHNKLNALSKELIEKYNSCLIIDCHSFTDENGHPDICLGINSSYNKDLINMVYSHFSDFGLSVKINFPFSGSITPSNYYNKNLSSIMIEINKKLYLNGQYGFIKNLNNYNHIKNIIQLLYDKLIKNRLIT